MHNYLHTNTVPLLGVTWFELKALQILTSTCKLDAQGTSVDSGSTQLPEYWHLFSTPEWWLFHVKALNSLGKLIWHYLYWVNKIPLKSIYLMKSREWFSGTVQRPYHGTQQDYCLSPRTLGIRNKIQSRCTGPSETKTRLADTIQNPNGHHALLKQ